MADDDAGVNALLVPKSEPFSEDFELEDVQIMGEEDLNFDTSDSDSSEGQHHAVPKLETTVKKLVGRVRALEQQVAACLESQPLLYQLFGKCNRLEQRMKEMRKETGGRSGKVNDLAGVRSSTSFNKHQSLMPRAIRSNKTPVPNMDIDSEDDNQLEPDANDSVWQPSTSHVRIRNNTSRQDNAAAPGEASGQGQIQVNDLHVPPPPRPRSDTGNEAIDQLVCRYCQKLITRKARLREHEFYHRVGQFENPGDFTCKEQGCDFVGIERRDVLDHYRTVHPTSAILKPLKCKLCTASAPGAGVGFYDEEALASHYTKFHPAGTSSNYRSRYRESVARRTCRVCSKVFGRAWEMKQHERIKHSNKPPPRVSCDLCGKSYRNRRVAKTHQLQVHGQMSEAIAALFQYHEDGADALEPVEKVSCEECGIEVLEKSLRSHMLTHGGKEPRYSCETCGQTFFHTSRLQRHQAVHTGERPFVCSHEGCTKAFSRKPALAEHMLLHTGKPHLCDECGWAGATPRDLRRHKEKHANGTLRVRKPGRPRVRAPRRRAVTQPKAEAQAS